MAEYTNQADTCAEDPIQIIVNNLKGGDKEVRFHIENTGECDVVVGVSSTRNIRVAEWDEGEPQDIPCGASEDVFYTVAAGKFLKATCSNVEDKRCEWKITT